MVKWLRDGLKKIGKGVRKGVSFVENVVNKADKYSGGLLRSMADKATMGLSEEALKFYNQTKGARNMLLNAAEGQKLNKKDLVNNVKNAYGNISIDTRNKIYSESNKLNDKLNYQLNKMNINDRAKNAIMATKSEKLDNKIFNR